MIRIETWRVEIKLAESDYREGAGRTVIPPTREEWLGQFADMLEDCLVYGRPAVTLTRKLEAVATGLEEV